MRRSFRKILIFSSLLTGTAGAQQPTILTLGEAARLAARQSAPALIAQLETREAAARVTQARADLLPSLRTSALESGHTLNSATFGFDFPSPEGETPLLNPNGQIIGPVNTLDLRAHGTVPAIDCAARERVGVARAAEILEGFHDEHRVRMLRRMVDGVAIRMVHPRQVELADGEGRCGRREKSECKDGRRKAFHELPQKR